MIGAYSAFRSGHDLNNKLLRAVLADPASHEFVSFDDARRAPAGFAELAPAW
jgi:UDP-3-O-[3-hydroxymyristoyl] N-acetylglucosamine deacetylase